MRPSLLVLGSDKYTAPLPPYPMWMDAVLFDLADLGSQCLLLWFDVPSPPHCPVDALLTQLGL